MAFVYLFGIPIIIIAWISWFNAGMNKPSRFLATGTPIYTALPSTARPSGFGGFTVDQGVTRPSATPAPSLMPGVSLMSPPETLGAAEPLIIVVTATLTPIPTLTPNPYGTLHVTLTHIWRLAYTATPYAATEQARPLYYMHSGECFKNCGFVTVTPIFTPTS